MAELVLRVVPSPARLLHEAADGEHGFRLDHAYLLLRQGGLRDDLLALAGGAGHAGWFSPPFAVFHELPERFGAADRAELSGDERAVLIERLMLEHGGAVFGCLERPAEFVDAIETLFGELAALDVSPERLGEAVGRVDYLEEFDRERNRAIADVYRAYVDARGERLDGRDRLVDVARVVATDPEAFGRALGGRRELRILGLTDLRGGWGTLLDTLASSPALDRVVLYALDEHLLSEGVKPDRVSSDPAQTVPKVAILHAPDTGRELEAVAVRVRELIDAGVPPGRIAVVSRKARPHVDLVLDTLERIGVPATGRRRIGYREIPVVKGLVTLFSAAAEGWTRHGLSELARQPYFGRRLDVQLIDFLGYRRMIAGLGAWRAALDTLVVEAKARESSEESDDERRGWLPTSERAQRALERFEELLAVASELDRPKPLAEWLGWLDQFLADDPWGVEQRIRRLPPGRWELARVDLAGWKALRATVKGWRDALDRWGGPDESLDAEALLERLGTVLGGDAALWTTCRRGVQVLEGLAAAYRHFDHLLLVGLEAGTFPTRRPRSPILHEEDRRALVAAGVPLDLEPIWEEREESLFRSLVLGAPSVHLSHAVLDASGREVIGSAFLDDAARIPGVAETSIPTSRVLSPGFPLFDDPDLATAAALAARAESERETGALNPWNGAIEEPGLRALLAERYGEDYLWSPTQLEGYAKCPWSWFSARALKLDKHEDPGQEIDAAVRGTIWHAALEGFWSKAIAKLDRDCRTGESRLLRGTDADWALPMLAAALDQAWATAEGPGWLGHPGMREVTRASLARTLEQYLTWELEYNDKAFKNAGNARKILRTAVDAHELVIGGISLDRNGVRFRYRGVIDRVEVGVDERVPSADFVAAVDYKSSIYSTPGSGHKDAWLDGVVLQVPLYAHALTVLRAGSRVSRVEYRSLRTRETAHVLGLVVVDPPKAKVLREDPEAMEKMERALSAAAHHVAAVRDGRFPASPAPSCKCPPFCAAWDICRVRGGPKKAAW
ncbi:MAG: PD-(D/E)XK nuclease family protein [Gemmatimonadales bacterium]